MKLRVELDLTSNDETRLAKMIAHDLTSLPSAPKNSPDGFTTGKDMGISPRTVRRWVREGKIEGYRPEKQVLVKREDLSHYIESCPVKPPPMGRPAPPPDGETIESALANGKLRRLNGGLQGPPSGSKRPRT